MGDYTQANLQILALPDTLDVDRLLTFLNEDMELSAGYFPQQEAIEAEAIKPGAEFEDENASLMFCDNLAPLDEMGITYIATQDSKYEYDGEVRIGIPGLGVFHSVTNGYGTPTVTLGDVRDFLGSCASIEEARNRWAEKNGSAFWARVEALRKEVSPRPTTAPPTQ